MNRRFQIPHSILFYFLCLLLALGGQRINHLSAQQKSALTLHQAVLGSYGDLRPETLRSFQWIPQGSAYAYKVGQGDAERLVVKDLENYSHREVTLSMLNNGVKSQGFLAMRFFPAVEWLSNNEFIFDYYRKVFVYNLNTQEVRLLMMYDDRATNTDFNNSQGHLAYTIENNLYIHHRDNSVQQITDHQAESNVIAGKAIHRFEFGITKGTFWSPDGIKLAFYESDNSNITDYPLIDYSQEPNQVVPYKYPRSGEKSELPKVRVLDVSSGETIYLDTGSPEERYLTNLTWSPDGESIFLVELNREQRHLQLVRYNASTGERVGVVLEENDEKYIEPLHGPLFLPESDNEFLWFSRKDGYNHLYHWSTNGEMIRQVTSGKFDVAAFSGFTDRGGSAVVTAHQPATEKHVFLVDIQRGKMKPISKEPGVYNSTISADSDFMMVTWSNDTLPGQNDLYRTNGDFVSTLKTAENPIASKITGTSEIVEIGANDGTPLYGRLIKPSHFDPEKKYPVLVYVYGGPHVQLVKNAWLSSTALWMFYLAEQGYLVFTLDNRGTANRGKDFEQQTYRQLGTLEIQDQLRGVEYLKTLPFVDAEKLAVYGWSYGGFLSASLMLRTPGVFKASVSGGTITDWRKYEVMYTERYMDTPQNNPQGYEIADLKAYVDNLNGDLLLINGTSDNIVLPEQSMSLLGKFVEAGIQVDYFSYPGHGHNIQGKDRLHLKQKVLDYIMEKIPAYE